MMAEKLEDRDVKAIWFCSAPISEAITEFIPNYKIALQLISFSLRSIRDNLDYPLSGSELNQAPKEKIII